MDISDFLVDKYETEQYDYKVLVYGNYTFRDNLEADSLVEVLRRVIPYLSERRKIHFTILIPEFVKSLNFPNVEQRIYTLPTYINQMRTHFDSIQFMKYIDWKRNDWDIIYTHLPEHTNQIANCIFNNTNIMPKIVGYSHWFEVPENAPYAKNMLDSSVAGLLQMDECGVNSEWLKRLTIKHAAKHYNQDVLDKLEKIIQPHYLGVDRVNPRKVSEYTDKTVVFNHRDGIYTGSEWFFQTMDELWNERQDFEVWTSLKDMKKPYTKYIGHADRNVYMNQLGQAHFGVGCFQTYSAWSMSTTDGLSRGVPYLLPNGLCYPEMVGNDYPLLYNGKDEFKQKVIGLLDETIERPDVSAISKALLWENSLKSWDIENNFEKMARVFVD